MKWGITWREFQRDYVQRSATVPPGELPAVPAPSTQGRMKRMFHGAKGFPLEDLRAWDENPSRHLVLSEAP